MTGNRAANSHESSGHASHTTTDAIRMLLSNSQGPYAKCESASLRLNKYVVLEQTNQKVKEIKRLAKCITDQRQPVPFPYDALQGAQTLLMTLQSRLIVNQAGGILENAGLCLHPHFGCPMLPGSAVKGIARAAAIQAVIDADTTDKKVRLLIETALTFGWCSQEWKDTDIQSGEFTSDLRYAVDGGDWRKLWGDTARFLLDFVPSRQREINEREPWTSLPDFGGLVSFLPAYPVPGSEIKVVPDVVNCHHPEYYQGNRERADDTENPIPNFFPAVEAGLSFEFVVVPVHFGRIATAAARLSEYSPVESALGWLEQGLSEHGIGAKTNAGYGWFERDAAAEERAEKARQRAEAARREEERVASLSPEERAAEEFEASITGDADTFVKGRMRNIADIPNDEATGLLHYLRLNGTGQKFWRSDVTEATKTKDPSDKKHGKALIRVTAVREAAQRLGVELP